MNNLGPDHIFDSNINPLELQSIAKELEEYMMRTLDAEDKDLIRRNPETHAPITTNIHDKYNILTYPHVTISKLYHSISDAFYSIKPDGNYFIKMWLNVFKSDQYLSYHKHMQQNIDAFYGHVSIKGGGITTYKNINTEETFDYKNKDGFFVLSRPCNDVQHRTWPQSDERVTFGFDIANIKFIDKETRPFSFWVPL